MYPEAEKKKHETRIRELINSKQEVTMDFMRAVRNFKMSVRGSTVLHVVKTGTPGTEVTPMIQKVLQLKTNGNGSTRPQVITSSTLQEAKSTIVNSEGDLRIVVIESDLNYPLEGINLAEWIRDNYPHLPVLLVTEDEKEVPQIKEKMPYMDIFLAGVMGASELMRLFGAVLQQGESDFGGAAAVG